MWMLELVMKARHAVVRGGLFAGFYWGKNSMMRDAVAGWSKALQTLDTFGLFGISALEDMEDI